MDKNKQNLQNFKSNKENIQKTVEQAIIARMKSMTREELLSVEWFTSEVERLKSNKSD